MACDPPGDRPAALHSAVVLVRNKKKLVRNRLETGNWNDGVNEKHQREKLVRLDYQLTGSHVGSQKGGGRGRAGRACSMPLGQAGQWAGLDLGVVSLEGRTWGLGA